jgi:hypothetical protein
LMALPLTNSVVLKDVSKKAFHAEHILMHFQLTACKHHMMQQPHIFTVISFLKD